MDKREQALHGWQSKVARINKVAALFGLGLLLGIILSLITPLPWIPYGSGRLDVPQTLTVQTNEGKSITLTRDEQKWYGTSQVIPLLPSATWLDRESHAAQRLQVLPKKSPEESSQPRFRYADSSSRSSEAFDPSVRYYLDAPYEPTLQDSYDVPWPILAGDAIVVDDPGIRSISHIISGPVGARDEPPQMRFEFKVTFDLIKSYELGRTDISVPVGWFGSRFFVLLNSSPVWMIGISGAGLLVSLIVRAYCHRQLARAWR